MDGASESRDPSYVPDICWENREQIQELLLLGQCKEIEIMHILTRPLNKAKPIELERDPPKCIANEIVYRLPAQNNDVFLVGDADRRIVKMSKGEIVEERKYIEGFTLQGLLLAEQEIRLAYAAIEDYHKQDLVDTPLLRERMPWATEATLSAIADLPGPTVRCHLDATTANILITPSCDSSMLIDDEYHAIAPAVLDYGIFIAKLKRKEGIVLPRALLPDMPGLEQAADLAHRLWLESK